MYIETPSLSLSLHIYNLWFEILVTIQKDLVYLVLKLKNYKNYFLKNV